MRPCRTFRRALLAGAVVSLSASAGAQGTETDVAAQFFETAAAAAKRGEYRVCAEAFGEAHKRAPHGATIYNAGLCWESAKDRARAANDYKEALRLGGLSPAQDQQAKKRLSALSLKLGEMRVSGPRGQRASAGPIEQAVIPFSTYIEPGEIEVKMEGPDGEVVSRVVKIAAGDQQDVDLSQPKEERTPKPVAPKPERDQRAPANGGLQRTAGWVLIGASVAAAGVGVAYYLSAVDAADEFDKNKTSQALHDRAESRYRTAQIFWLGAGIGAVAGATLILTAPKSKSNKPATALVLRLSPSAASAAFHF